MKLCRYTLLVENLLLCDNLRSAYDFAVRRYNASHSERPLEELERRVKQRLQTYFEERGDEYPGDLRIEDYPDRGLVRRELYPWNVHEPDRFLDASLEHLNKQMESIAPNLEVKIIELPDLLKRYVMNILSLGFQRSG